MSGSRAQAPEPEPAPEWFCAGDGSVKWKYSSDDAAKLEAAFLAVKDDHPLEAASSDAASVVLRIDGSVYDVNVVTMTQTNRKTKFERSVRREVIKAAETPAALLVSGASVDAVNGVYDLEVEHKDSRPVWTRRQSGHDACFKIQWCARARRARARRARGGV